LGTEPGDVTLLLMEMRRGNQAAEAKLIPLIYKELRRLASHYLRRERPNHTLQPTALVHEAYLRLVKIKDVDWQDRSHFFAIAATVMRRILVDHARAQQAGKREGMRKAIDLDQAFVVSPTRSRELLALDEALNKLHQINARQSRIVELRFFVGLSEEETGAILGISSRTVKRDWRFAKAWLYDTVHRHNRD
jgi:RNA polymerase sigma-70 factor (ECF subfamily)